MNKLAKIGHFQRVSTGGSRILLEIKTYKQVRLACVKGYASIEYNL
jgi:hypothetical protein